MCSQYFKQLFISSDINVINKSDLLNKSTTTCQITAAVAGLASTRTRPEKEHFRIIKPTKIFFTTQSDLNIGQLLLPALLLPGEEVRPVGEVEEGKNPRKENP